MATKLKKVDDRILRLYVLGGLHELGKNMFVFEAHNPEKPEESEYIILDAGLRYIGHEEPGIDYAMADYRFLKDKKKQIKALILTSPHDRHCGAAHQIICNLEIENVYGPGLALELTKAELNPETVKKINWTLLDSRLEIDLDPFIVTSYYITSHTGENYALLIEALGKKIFYSGSFKIDQTPTDGRKTDVAGMLSHLSAKAEFAKVADLYIGDSTNVEISGYSKSEKDIIPTFKKIFAENKESRIIVNTYDSNVVRIVNLFALAQEFNRKVVLVHRNMRKVVAAVERLYTYDINDEMIISIQEAKDHKDSELLLLTGSPEDLALDSLEMITYNKSLELNIKEGDVIVNSADLPPGTVRKMAQISDQCFLRSVKMIGGRNANVNVESNALTEELKFMFNVTRPKYFLPALGETRQLVKHAKLAVETGFDPGSILILDNGDVIEFAENNVVRVIEQVPYEEILYSMMDHYVLEEHLVKARDVMSREGVVIVSFSLNRKNKKIVAGPLFSAKACTFSKNKEWKAFCMFNTQPIVEAVDALYSGKPEATIQECEEIVKNHMQKVIKQQIGKRPELIVHASQV